MNVSKTGMQAQQRALSLISNNIANVSTQGFKAKKVNFNSLMSNEITEDNRVLAENFSISAGVKSQQSGMNVAGGSFYEGASPFDLAINGEGFFGIQNAAGDLYLTKDGSFFLDEIGQLVNSNGDFLVVDGQVPLIVENRDNFSIGSDGTAVGLVNGEMTKLGTVPLYLPNNIQALRSEGNNYYSVPEGEYTINANPNNIQVSALELSNVDLAIEFTDMIVAQRAYALNVKVAQTTDEIQTITNQFS